MVGFFAELQMKSDLQDLHALPPRRWWERRPPFEIVRIHQKVFPSSKLRTLYVTAGILAVGLALAFIVLGPHGILVTKTQ